MRLRSVFTDTSFICALFTPEGRNHKQALNIVRELCNDTEIRITGAVLDEGYSFSSTGKHLPTEYIRDYYSTGQIYIVKTDEPPLMKILTIHSVYPDKGLSLTDYLPFEVINERNISTIYSSDNQIDHAGFQSGFDKNHQMNSFTHVNR